MTDSKETTPDDDDAPKNGESQEPADNEAENQTDSDSSDKVPAAETGTNVDDDELPEDEELTPELVEEEAIRGDFMLRWASIFLAVLFGFSQIAETRTLVSIRAGDQMRSSGFLPSGQDAFAYTLEGKSAPNVSWMFDHVVSLVYSIGGEHGLTIFKAFMAGLIAYLLSLISISGMPTWWSSICCVLAIGACSIDFIPATDLATLVGMVVTLLLLHRYLEGTTSGIAWKLPLLVAVWANFDSRAWLGVLLVALFAVGLKLRNTRAQNAGDPTGPDIPWQAAGFAALALLVNPAPVASLLSVVTTYTVEYPTMAAMMPLSNSAALLDGRTEYFSVWIPEGLQGFEFGYLAGLSLVLIALIVLVISRNREDLPWALPLLGFMGLAAFRLHELPAAALIAAVTAGTAAQRWYSRTFRQDYTVDSMEVLFSRGGRAVTVFAMAFLGFFIVADRLPTRTSVGMGFDPDMKTTMESLGQQFAELPEGARVLPTRMSQGDYLIWHGYQTFVDSRASLYGKYADSSSVIHHFDAMRKSLLVSQPPEEEPASESQPKRMYNPNWKQEYDDMGISHVMVRLAPPGVPAYAMANAFGQLPSWELTNRGASAAFFRYTKELPEKPSYDTRQLAFRTSVMADVERFDFAREKNFYDKYLYDSRFPQSAALREAQHHYVLDSQTSPQVVFNIASAVVQDPTNSEYMSLLGSVMAGPLMTIRSANSALVQDTQNAAAYQLLGTAYMQLDAYEAAIAGAFGGERLKAVRYMQAVMAFRQALLLEPESSESWNNLVNLYQEAGRTGLAFDCLERFLAIEEDQLGANPTFDDQLRQMYELRRAWKERREAVQEQLDTVLEGDWPENPQQHALEKLNVVRDLRNEGHIRLALKLAEDNIDLLRPIPEAELLRGEMLLEVGELEDGYSVLNQLAAVARENLQRPEFVGLRWHGPVALSHLAKGAYAPAIEAWNEQLSLLTDVENKAPELLQPITRTLPLVPEAVTQVGGVFANWPLLHLQSVQVPLDTLPASRAEPKMLVAMANVESGNVANARFVLQGLISEEGENKYRPLAEIYLSQLTDDAATLIASATLDPWEDFEFPEIDDASPEKAIEPAKEATDTPPDADSAKPTADKAAKAEPTEAADNTSSDKDDDSDPKPVDEN